MTFKKGDTIRFAELPPSCFNGSIPVLYTPRQSVLQKLFNKLRKKDPDSKLVEIPIITFKRK